jgi:iron complex transport system ATP-binding protein
MLSLEAISVMKDRRLLLQNVDLSVAVGEVVALIGPNGAGKSTLLEVAAGDFAPDEGRVQLGGRALATIDRKVQARLRAVIGQRDGLELGLTALEVVLLGRWPHASNPRRDRSIAEAALGTIGAEALSHQSYPTLSGGERQRVQLARALAQIWEDSETDAPRLLLLDEPTSALDAAHAHQVLATIRRIAKGPVAVLIVLHDLSLAAAYADRLVLLAHGRVLSAGTPDVALDPAALERAYGVPLEVLRVEGRPHPIVLPRLDPEIERKNP